MTLTRPTPGDHLLITRARAQAQGLNTDQINDKLKSGAWRRLLRNVYYTGGDTNIALATAVRAGQLAYGDDVVVSFETAAELLGGVRLNQQPHQTINLILPLSHQRFRQPTAKPGMPWNYHLERRDLPSRDVLTHHYARVTSPSVTVRDLLPRLDPVEAVCLLDAALAAEWVTLQSLPGVLDPMTGPARQQAFAALARCRVGAQSALETRIRLMCEDAGFPPDELQYPVVVNGQVIARGDLAWRRRVRSVVAECDGREFHDTPVAVHHDRDRQNRIQAAGVSVLRARWSDLFHPKRFLCALAQTLELADG